MLRAPAGLLADLDLEGQEHGGPVDLLDQRGKDLQESTVYTVVYSENVRSYRV